MAVCVGRGWGVNVQTVNMENEGTILPLVSDFNYLVIVISESEKGF